MQDSRKIPKHTHVYRLDVPADSSGKPIELPSDLRELMEGSFQVHLSELIEDGNVVLVYFFDCD